MVDVVAVRAGDLGSIAPLGPSAVDPSLIRVEPVCDPDGAARVAVTLAPAVHADRLAGREEAEEHPQVLPVRRDVETAPRGARVPALRPSGEARAGLFRRSMQLSERDAEPGVPGLAAGLRVPLQAIAQPALRLGRGSEGAQAG